MKTTIEIYLAFFLIFSTAFKCEKEEPLPTSALKGKFLQNWCASEYLVVVQIISEEKIGDDWNKISTKEKYKNVVLAQLDSTLLNKWNSTLIESIDSTFYFSYYSKPISICYKCCPPDKTIIITSISGITF